MKVIYQASEVSLIIALLISFCYLLLRSLRGRILCFSTQTFMLLCAFGIYVIAHIDNDQTLQHVSLVCNDSLSIFYRIASVWSDHQGSYFLWVVTFSLCVMIMVFLKPQIFARTNFINQMGFSLGGLLLYLLTYNNPMSLSTQKNLGLLNPLLHDASLAFHPPLLYLGQVGLLVCASAVLLFKKENLIQLKSFILIFISFLTLGITWGSFWAYYELGWGGWWFWDPVENIALLPWILGIFMVHAYRVQRMVDLYIVSRFLIFIILLGIFIVRSGIISSVHSFAFDGYQGLVIFTVLLSLFAFMTYQKHTPQHRMQTQHTPTWFLQQKILLWALFFIISATLMASLLYKIFGNTDLNFQPEFFEITAVPLGIVVCLFLGNTVGKSYNFSLTCGLILAVTIIHSYKLVVTGLAAGIALYTITMTVNGFQKNRLSAGSFLAHLGFAMFVFSVSLNNVFALEKSFPVNQHQKITHHHFFVTDIKVQTFNLSHYKEQHLRAYLKPLWGKGIHITSKIREYPHTMKSMVGLGLTPMGLFFLTHKIDHLKKGGFVIYVRHDPFIIFIWLGGILMMLGFICSGIKSLKKGYRRTPIQVEIKM